MGILKIVAQTLCHSAAKIRPQHISTPTTRGLFNVMGVRYYAPGRYRDPHEAAAAALKEGRLDRHAFHNWQALINHFAYQGDEPCALRAYTLAKRDGENPIVGDIHPEPSFAKTHDSVQMSQLTIGEIEAGKRFAKMANDADQALKTGSTNNSFSDWAALRQYYLETDNTRAYDLINHKIDRFKEIVQKALTDAQNTSPKTPLTIDPTVEREIWTNDKKAEFIRKYIAENKSTIAEAIRVYRASQGLGAI